MKIGMILDYTFPPDPRVENEAIALINKGHKVFLFSLKYTAEPDFEDINGIKVFRYKTNKLEYKLSALAYTFPFYTKLMQPRIVHFLENNAIDVIHIHDMRIADAVFKANKILNLPTVLDLHDNMPEIMKFYPHMQKFPGKQLISPKKWKIKEEEFIGKATNIITVSQEFIDEVVGRTKISTDKIHLVPNTVLPSFYENAVIDNNIIDRYKESFVLLYLGDTGIRRGLLTAIESLILLEDNIPNVKLVIVGKNSTDVVLKQKVKELGLEKYVDFEGWQNVSLFPSYIVASNICISPLNRNIQHDVAYANKLFQYMSFGKPLLVSDAIAQKRLIERVHSGLVHQEQDSKDFSENILRLYTDENLQKELGANGEKFIKEEFNWNKTAEVLLNLYDNLKN